MLDADALKEIGIATVEQRLTILKAVYNKKVAQGVAIEPGHYAPSCELYTNVNTLTLSATTWPFNLLPHIEKSPNCVITDSKILELGWGSGLGSRRAF